MAVPAPMADELLLQLPPERAARELARACSFDTRVVLDWIVNQTGIAMRALVGAARSKRIAWLQELRRELGI